MQLRLLTDPLYAEEHDIVVDELTHQYVDGQFDSGDREQFEQYFFAARQRREKLEFTLSLKQHSKMVAQKAKKRASPKPLTYYLTRAAAVLIVAGLGFLIWRMVFTRTDLNKGLQALRTAYRAQRPVEARISDFAYAPSVSTRGEPANVDSVQRTRAGSFLANAVSEDPNAASHHGLGQYYLADRQFDLAIEQFKEALKLDPPNPKIHSDLGAALFEKGKTQLSKEGSQTELFAEALTHLKTAFDTDNSRLDALFNLALLHGEMVLLTEAQENWKTYLSKDSDSKWAEEARIHLKSIEEELKKTSQSRQEILKTFLDCHESRDDLRAWRIISSYQNRTGNVIGEQLLDAYLDDTINNRTTAAAQNLQRLAYLGELAVQKARDRYWHDLVQYYTSTTPDQRTALVKARELMKVAYDDWGKVSMTESLGRFSKAKELFERVGDRSEGIVAGHWISFSHYQNHHPNEALAQLKSVSTVSQARDYKSLTVRNLYLSSLLQNNLTNYSRALELALDSLNLANETNDVVGELNALNSLIEYYRSLNNVPKSLGYIQRSHPLLRTTTLDAIQGYRHYSVVALSLVKAGWLDAAAAYQKKAFQYAVDTGRPTTVITSFAYLSQINVKRGKFNEAMSDAQRAFEIAEAHSNERGGRDLMAYASLQMGHIHRENQNLEKAIQNYDRSIKLYEELEFDTHLYQAHKGRLLCYLAQGNDRLAEEEILKTLSLVESYRDKIIEGDNRDSFFGAEQSVYDLAMAFEYPRPDGHDRAFDYSESSRARSLLDLVNKHGKVIADKLHSNVIFDKATRPLTITEIRQRMPAQVQLLQYAVLKDQILIWVVTKESVSSSSVAVTQQQLEEKVGAYTRIISSPIESTDETRARARELYDFLIKPVESYLDSGKEIYVIPDKILGVLPFNTLMSPKSGKYLVEEYLLLLSPSSTLFITCSEVAGRKDDKRTERILSVGNPRFNRDRFPWLADLPSAAIEAKEVAAFYQSRRQLIEDDATKEMVKSGMKDADVVHLAMHAILDEQSPLQSRFPLTRTHITSESSQSQEDVLFASELYDISLPKTRLAVLSACETGAGPQLGGEGVVNMARPFIVAGVPLVVASLWPVETDSTANFMINFHRLRARTGLSSAQALHRAQLEMLHGSEKRFRQPFYWAPFVVIGGQAKY